jgi:hypothetical protein
MPELAAGLRARASVVALGPRMLVRARAFAGRAVTDVIEVGLHGAAAVTAKSPHA